MKRRKTQIMTRTKRGKSQIPQEQALTDKDPGEDDSASLASHSSYPDSEIGSDKAVMDSEAANEAASLEAILKELKAARRDNENNFRDIKEDMKSITGRVIEAENRISELEDRSLQMEEAAIELIQIQEKLEAKILDLEGRSRRENLRFHGIPEGSENSSASVPAFLEELLKSKLNIPPTLDLNIERAHRSLGPRPPPEAPPRSIIAKFSSFKTKEETLRLVWQMKGFTLDGKKVIIDHDYIPEVMKQRREYTEAKKILKENKIKFQTPYPARMRVFYNDGTRVYNTAAEATEDMVKRGFTVTIIRPRTSWAEKMRSTVWRRAGQTDQSQTHENRNERGYKKRLDAFRRESL